MLNVSFLAGHLGNDATVKPVGEDKASTLFTFRVATDTFVGGKSITEWHSVKYFCSVKAYAEILTGALKKGALVYAFGDRRTDEWIDEEGNEHRVQRLYADDVKLLSAAQPKATSERVAPSTALPNPAAQVTAQPAAAGVAFEAPVNQQIAATTTVLGDVPVQPAAIARPPAPRPAPTPAPAPPVAAFSGLDTSDRF